MKAFWVKTGRRITPFDDAPTDAWFGLTTVGAAVRDVLTRRGFEIVELDDDASIPAQDAPAVVLGEHVYVSNKCLGDFLALALGSEDPLRLWLCRTPATDYARPCATHDVAALDESGRGAKPAGAKDKEADATERVGYDVFYLPPGEALDGPVLASLRERAGPQVVKKRELSPEFRMPILGDPDQTKMIFPVTSTVAAHVEHWVHILWLNQLALGVMWMDIVRAHKVWTAWRVVRAFPLVGGRLTRSLVRRGKGVRIHPTAHVEASILGDGVVIGPRATVQNSIVADGAEVGDHAAVLGSTIGPGAFVAPKSYVVWSTIYPESVSYNLKLQMSVLGRRATCSPWSGLIDAKFQGHIQVVKDGQRMSTERSFLGSCIGHEAYVGAKVLIHPGREVPNQTQIVMRPDELVETIPADLPARVPVVRDQGTLVPLTDLVARAKAAAPTPVPAAAQPPGKT